MTFKNDINYGKKMSLEEQETLLPLSFKGEKKSCEILKQKELLETENIYSSNYISMISTAKYLSEELNLPINIENQLNERKIGHLSMSNEKILKETQAHDFDFHLPNGESINQVKERMKKFLKSIIGKHFNKTTTLFTHDVAASALFSIWCEKGYNLENQLILTYQEEVIIDGAFHNFRIFKLEFEETKLKNIEWLNKDE